MWSSITHDALVHYAGNLQIAASVFIFFGFIFSLVMVITLFMRFTGSTNTASQGDDSNEKPHRVSSLPRLSFLILQVCLYIGVVLQILAQFFGVLGLTINATPNAGDATADQYYKPFKNFVAHDWVIGKALSTYATVAWTSALACAVIASLFFQMPRFKKPF